MQLNWRKPVAMSLLRLSGSGVPEALKFVKGIEYEPPAVIAEIQRTRLARLLRHAWENTDYYAQVLQECGAVTNEGGVHLDRFDSIPFLTRELVRSEGSRMLSRRSPARRRRYRNRTGGSTGEPVEVWQDSQYWDTNVANKLYRYETGGKAIGEPEVKIWATERDLIKDTSGLKARLLNFLYGRHVIPCAKLSEADILSAISDLNRIKPKLIYANAHGISIVAEHVNRAGLQVHPPGVILAAGCTLLPHMRESIQRAFRCKVFNYFGCREVGDIACECMENHGLHVASHSVYVEVIGADGRPTPDGEGEILVTSLTNDTMPLIRYRIGDRARATQRRCACGRGFPLLDDVLGRRVETFVTASGDRVNPAFCSYLLPNPEVVSRFQLIQEDYSRVVVKLVTNPKASGEELRETLDGITQKIRGVMGGDCAVDYEFLANIPTDPSGKYSYALCRLGDQRQAS